MILNIRGDAILGLIFRDEYLCLFCKEVKDKKLRYICEDCYEFLEFRSEEIYIEGYEFVYCVLEYNKIIREHLSSYKYRNNPYYYKVFGDIMEDEIRDEEWIRSIDYIIPVPLHRAKKARRGFNQSELLGEYLSEKLGIEILTDVLYKNRKTKSQQGLKGNERRKNLLGAFSLKNEEKLKGKNLLIVDDVLTTGATLVEISKLFGECELTGLYGLTLSTAK